VPDTGSNSEKKYSSLLKRELLELLTSGSLGEPYFEGPGFRCSLVDKVPLLG